MRKRQSVRRTEVIEAMIGHIGSALKGELDPRGAKELLIGLLAAGGVVVALSLEPALLAGALGLTHAFRYGDKGSRKKAREAMQYIRSREYVTVRERDGEVVVHMTEKGRLAAKRHTLRFLSRITKKSRKWDGQWHVIMFDIPAEERNIRNAFRTLIRRIGAVQLQKSVWIYLFDCEEQVGIFRSFFNFNDQQLRILKTVSIGDDSKYRAHFKL